MLLAVVCPFGLFFVCPSIKQLLISLLYSQTFIRSDYVKKKATKSNMTGHIYTHKYYVSKKYLVLFYFWPIKQDLFE